MKFLSVEESRAAAQEDSYIASSADDWRRIFVEGHLIIVNMVN